MTAMIGALLGVGNQNHFHSSTFIIIKILNFKIIIFAGVAVLGDTAARWLLAFTAGNFFYISLADMVQTLHSNRTYDCFHFFFGNFLNFFHRSTIRHIETIILHYYRSFDYVCFNVLRRRIRIRLCSRSARWLINKSFKFLHFFLFTHWQI